MIATQLFNFKRNKLNAAKYRLELRNLNKDSTDTEVESLYFLKRFNDSQVTFSLLNRENIVDGIIYENSYKSFAFFLNYEERNINSTITISNSFYKKTENYFKTLNKEIIKLKEKVKEESLLRFSKFNKIKIINYFKEKEFNEEYDLIDFKTNYTLLKSEQCFYKSNGIETRRVNESTADIVSIEVIKEKSFVSDELEVLNVENNTSFIHREEKTWNYIVGAKEFLENGQVLPHKNCKLELVVNLDGFEEINNFILESGSSLPYEIEGNSLYIWKEDKSWEAISFTKIADRFNYKELLFEPKYTSKIKFKLIQSKYHDTGLVNETENKLDKVLNRSFLQYNKKIKEKKIKRIYDLSILKLEVKRKFNYRFGFYREANPIMVNQGLSASFKTLKSYEASNCFIEKYLHLVLYGDAEVDSFKEVLKLNTQRKNIIIPIPNNIDIESELIVFNESKIGKLNFCPKLKDNLTESIKIYEDENLLNIRTDYLISVDEGVTYTWEYNVAFNSNINKCGSFLIKLLKPLDKRKTYKCEYSLNEKMSCDEEGKLFIKEGELLFAKELQSSIGFIRPVILIRNKNKFNSSSIIKELQILVEEKATKTLEDNIDYEEFIEIKRRGTENVV